MRHAIITAGSKGLGKMVTEKLLESGCSVTVNFKTDTDRVEDLQTEWKEYQDQLQFVQGDITDKQAIENIVSQAFDRFGRIDYVINNAGPYVFQEKKMMDYEDREWYEMLEGNLSAVFHFSKQVIPIMREQGFGRIITYGFQDAQYTPGWMYRSAFSAAKVGLASLTKTIAQEEAENGITANMVCPGDITGDRKEMGIQHAKAEEDVQTPIGRPGSGGDIARLIHFLCSDESDLITGSVVEASGGLDVVNQKR